MQTARRDDQDLSAKHLLKTETAGGSSTNYEIITSQSKNTGFYLNEGALK